jgi:hypothetical protein
MKWSICRSTSLRRHDCKGNRGPHGPGLTMRSRMGGEHRGVSTDLLVVNQYEIGAGRIDSWSFMLCKRETLGIDFRAVVVYGSGGGWGPCQRLRAIAIDVHGLHVQGRGRLRRGCRGHSRRRERQEHYREQCNQFELAAMHECDSSRWQDANNAILPAATRTEYRSGADFGVRHPANRCRRDAYWVARSQLPQRPLARRRLSGPAGCKSHSYSSPR